MQSYHTVKKNSTSEYENTEQRKWLLELERDLWWKPLKWVKFLLGPPWTVHCAFFFFEKFIHSNTSPYAAFSPQICNHFSVWQLYHLKILTWKPKLFFLEFELIWLYWIRQIPWHIWPPIVRIAKCYSTRVHTH